MEIAIKNYQKVKKQLEGSAVRLVVVSKNQPNEKIEQIYQLGQRVFAENRVQDLLAKKDLLPADIEWQLIGHLQTNKVKQIIPFISLIQSIDSEKLLLEVNKQAEKCARRVDCLLQFHVAEEESKFGFEYEEAAALLRAGKLQKLANINLRGIMGMATNTEDLGRVRADFNTLKGYFERLKSEFFPEKADFELLSMGMSSDYQIALEEGANLLRLGGLMFADL